jgi:predicted phosphodiesterase
MKVAAIYDIHGNLPALEAVIAEIRQEGVDQVIVGGDVVPGPMPREALACLRELQIPIQFLYGNGEVAVLEQMAGKISAKVPEAYRPIIRWVAQQLDGEDERAFASWPKTLRLPIAGLGEALFCHATPRDENECFTRLTDARKLSPIFDELDVSMVVCGHTHMQFDRMIGKTRVVNAGSVGMPFGPAGADWLLLGSEVELRHTPYDLEKAADRIRATSYPDAGDFAAQYVLQPPSEEKMLAVFSRAELK